jgi:CheY-like chemotaxis protein
MSASAQKARPESELAAKARHPIWRTGNRVGSEFTHMAEVRAPLVGLAILIVDDDAAIRESLRFLLEEERYEVEEVTDGLAAIALLQTDRRPRVMLLDRMMPHLDGVQTLLTLAAQPETTRRTVTLFMSARHDPAGPRDDAIIRRETLATIIKPFDLDALLTTIERATTVLAERIATGAPR